MTTSATPAHPSDGREGGSSAPQQANAGVESRPGSTATASRIYGDGASAIALDSYAKSDIT
jgi:hypothetical protein